MPPSLIHICIGSVYAWSTFNRPINALFPNDPWWFSPPYTTFSTAIVLLGLSAAFGGPWVERRGPRVAATAAAMLFGAGLVIGGIGLALKQSVLVFLGMGVIGGMGCGLGYIAPVSTLVKWFPDRRGMATGMAIMGFGGGAFLAGYLNVYFMNLFGVAKTIIALGVVYFVIMMIGALLIRRPPEGWRPEGWTPPVNRNKMITDRHFTRNDALQTVQFYLLWGILFINVTAGIGILAQASPMMQDMFQKTAARSRRGGFSHQPVQRRRALLLGLFLRLHRPAQYLPYVFCRAGRPVSADPRLGRQRRMGDLRSRSVRGLHHVRRRFRHHSGVPRGHVRSGKCGRDSRRSAHRLERRRHRRSGDHHRTLQPRQRPSLAPGASKIHIYDQPLEVLAALLAVGFVLTLLVRPTSGAKIAQ